MNTAKGLDRRELLSACVWRAAGTTFGVFLIWAGPALLAGPAVQAWVQRYHGPYDGEHVPNAMAVDHEGNVFVTGYAMGSNGYIDCATVAYSGAGVPLWTNRYDGPARSYDEANAIAVDTRSGNVYVTGHSYEADGHSDCVTMAYSTAGRGLWTNWYNRPGPYPPPAGGDAILVGTDGDVYVAGSVGVMDSDYALVAYSGGAQGCGPTVIRAQTASGQAPIK